MDRRDFLKSTGGAAVAAAAGVVSASTLAADDALAAPALSTGVRTVTLTAPWEKILAGYADDLLGFILFHFVGSFVVLILWFV